MSLLATPRRWMGIALLLPMLLLLVACGDTASTPQATATTAIPTATAATSGPTVSTVGFSFQPSTLTVHVGDTVTWMNKGDVDHTVTNDTGIFDGELPAGQSFTFTFTTAGTFSYHCSIHPVMKGTIKVVA
jgi:plastocyanin